ncbi:hypothetical protein ACFC1R_06720 [Kitasatospora sp. NPDC056138]|uniref:hypothetical protein n=1 Tax=Kitasatospora sp. NPDC056138 TaxID=3345724 RepID=UPI0035DD81D9
MTTGGRGCREVLGFAAGPAENGDTALVGELLERLTVSGSGAARRRRAWAAAGREGLPFLLVR